MNDLVPMPDLQTMAKAVAKSGLFGAKNEDQALALMLVAQSEGLHPASAARDYDIIQGKGSKKSEAMMRDFLKAGGSVKWHALTDSMADATFSHPQGGEVRIDWDMKRAAKANLSEKDMYKKFPRQMLRARCISEGVRTVCPLATGGMYTPEEVQDMGPEKDMGTAVVVEQPKARSEPAKFDPPAIEGELVQNEPVTTETQAAQNADDPRLTAGEIAHLKAKMTSAKLTEEDLKTKWGVGLDELSKSDFKPIKAWIAEAK